MHLSTRIIFRLQLLLRLLLDSFALTAPPTSSRVYTTGISTQVAAACLAKFDRELFFVFLARLLVDLTERFFV